MERVIAGRRRADRGDPVRLAVSFRADLATCDAACPRLATLELAARQPSRDKACDLAALMLFPRIIARIEQLLSLHETTRTISPDRTTLIVII